MQDEVLKQPQFSPKIRMYLWQWVLAPFFLLIPILAISNYFGESVKTLTISESPLEISVEYPRKIRYRQTAPLNIEIRNSSGSDVKNISVHFERSYMDRFSNVKSTPALDGVYYVHLGQLAPNQTKSLRLDLQAEKYGTHHGSLIVKEDNVDKINLELKTTSFP